MGTIYNPILRGFHPDPSILRVGEEYYIATSTFEWVPGIRIHKSRDLKHWNTIASPLRRKSQIELSGIQNSCGIWASSLSYDKGVFYLVYSIVWTRKGCFKDVHNFLVTTNEIEGEWSEPIFLNSSGFDPFLFHDENGEKWLLNVNWDWRPENESFDGILAQRYDADAQRLVGEIEKILPGSSAGITEGVNLYKKDEYYYMVLAEGGTGYDHQVTLSRARQVQGPYELCPYNPIMTSRTSADNPLQRAGHASIVETQDGQWYMVYLASRPIQGRSILGRETAIEKIRWTDNQWFVSEGGATPRIEIPGLEIEQSGQDQDNKIECRDFDSETLPLEFQSLRVLPDSDMMSLTERPGWLRLKGWESITSQHKQTMIARRQQAFCYEVETKIEYFPENFRQMAGICCFYNTDNFYYLYISRHFSQRFINVLSCQNGEFSQAVAKILPDDGQVYLRIEGRYHRIQFFYSLDREDWRQVGKEFDALTLSDEYQRDGANYTGTFLGMCCQDLSGGHLHADFDWFWYSEAEK